MVWVFRVIVAKIVAHMVEAFVSRLVSSVPARKMRAHSIPSFSTAIKNLSVLIDTHTAAILLRQKCARTKCQNKH
jgi:hypothetical protein